MGQMHGSYEIAERGAVVDAGVVRGPDRPSSQDGCT